MSVILFGCVFLWSHLLYDDIPQRTEWYSQQGETFPLITQYSVDCFDLMKTWGIGILLIVPLLMLVVSRNHRSKHTLQILAWLLFVTPVAMITWGLLLPRFTTS